MDVETMEDLLAYYESGTVPTYAEIKCKEEDEFIGFDGSFGWW